MNTKNKIVAILMASIVAMAVGVPMAMGTGGGAGTSGTVNNKAPQIISVVITSGASVTPPGYDGTTNVTVRATVKDVNGYADISNVKIVACNNTLNASLPITLSYVGHNSNVEAYYDGNISMKYYEEPGGYKIRVNATDSASQVDTNYTCTFTYSTKKGLGIDVATVALGAADPGNTTEKAGDTSYGGSDPTLRNQGNVIVDLNINGTDLTNATLDPDIGISNLSYKVNTSYATLSGTLDEHGQELDLSRSTDGADSCKAISFKLAVPVGTKAGVYTGTVTLEAIDN